MGVNGVGSLFFEITQLFYEGKVCLNHNPFLIRLSRRVRMQEVVSNATR